MRREKLEELLRPIAEIINMGLQQKAGERVGFVLLLFDFEQNGWFTYASNGNRADVVRLLKEAVDKIGAEAQ